MDAASSRAELKDYQRNTTFVLFAGVVSIACLLYLTRTLVDVLVPLVWSVFFAVPLTALISRIENFLTHSTSFFWWLIRLNPSGASIPPVSFTATVGENSILLEDGPSANALLDKLYHPCEAAGYCCCIFSCCFRRQVVQCCKSRVRITLLTVEGGGVLAGHEVNRLVENWAYYAMPQKDDRSSATRLALFIDQDGVYPAVVERSTRSDQRLRGTVEVDRATACSWMVATLLSLCVMFSAVYVFFLCITAGVQALKENSSAYSLGAQEYILWLRASLIRYLPKIEGDEMEAHAMDFVKTAAPNLATAVTTHFEYIGFQTLLFIIYVMFWISEPLPINSSVAQVVKQYLLMKTIICILFAASISLLLLILNCPLWNIFFVAAFLLNYIPEVGFLAVFMMIVPAIAFDGNLTVSQRRTHTTIFVVGGILIKVITANIIEVKFYATGGGQYMRMHPVVVMALMMLCQQLLGITGMFLAIPIMAAVKYYMVSADMPGNYLNPLLLFIEGDETGPHKNFVDRHRADEGYGSTNVPPATRKLLTDDAEPGRPPVQKDMSDA